MSRGGRGGRGGGFGGSAATRMASGTLGILIDKELEAAFAQADDPEIGLFPQYFPHLAPPATEQEKEQIRFYLDLQDNVRNGWLAKAIEGLQAKNRQRAAVTKQFNPFEDVQQYGLKRGRGAEKVPKFEEFPFVKGHFPKELWCVLDSTDDTGAERKPKRLKLSAKSNRDKLAELDEIDEVPEVDKDDEDGAKKDDDEDAPEELQDNDFDEDDPENEELANDDYNAEQYFEDGESDHDDGGGDDGGGGEMD
nr:hypothetical protein B0A51_01781 [Rachicladosporium sp. CCFEE 5018]